jgi:D-glycero-alpha-D-manno-heptose-7-phosphate kinase
VIIVRSPLRITLGGGGTDLPSYANKYGGFCLTAAINKYCYVAINRTFQKGINLKYSEYERVDHIDDIKHPVFREVLKWAKFTTPQVEIISIADVPSEGAGLGNSGAFTVALIKAISSYKNIHISNEEIAELACDININKLGKTQGKQDEYASALGGIQCLEILPDSYVYHYSPEITFDKTEELGENLLLFYTNRTHNTEDILHHQEIHTISNTTNMLENLHKTKESGNMARRFLHEGALELFAKELDKQWTLKEERMPKKDMILEDFRIGFKTHGALGVKLVGSGMGGFFLVYSTDKARVRSYAYSIGLDEMHFQFDFEGCKRMI